MTQNNGDSEAPTTEFLFIASGFQPLGSDSYYTIGANCFLPFPMSKISLPNQNDLQLAGLTFTKSKVKILSTLYSHNVSWHDNGIKTQN